MCGVAYSCSYVLLLVQYHVDRRRWRSHQLTSDLKRCLLFRKCLRWSSRNKIFIAGGGCLTGESEPSRAAARFWFIRSDAPPTGYERLSFNPYLVRMFVVQLKRRSINPYAEKGLNKRVWNTIQTLSRVLFLLATPWQRAWSVERKQFRCLRLVIGGLGAPERLAIL